MKLLHSLTLTALVAFGLTSCDATDNGATLASLSDPRVKISNIDIGPINPDDIQTAYIGAIEQCTYSKTSGITRAAMILAIPTIETT